MKEVYLLVVAILFVAYMFATHDDPYIPINQRPKPYTSKRQLISWFAFRGPMFIEDFECTHSAQTSQKNKCLSCDARNKSTDAKYNDNIYIGSTYSDNPMNLPSDPAECCAENTMKKQKRMKDFEKCNQYAMSNSREPPAEETSQKSWENKYFNYPYVMRGPNYKTGDLGNYKQCTNNNLDDPNQLKCVGLGRIDADTCSVPHLVSHYDYKKNLDSCMKKMGNDVY